VEPVWSLLFFVALLFNFRACFKLLLDWKGMLTTCRFVAEAYARLDALPDEPALEADERTPVFLHLVPAYQEPDVGETVRALLASRYPHGKLHLAVVTKEVEEQAPHSAMAISTAEIVRRLRAELPPYQQKMVSSLVMPGEGRKAHQLNWALRPEHLSAMLGDQYLFYTILNVLQPGQGGIGPSPDPAVGRNQALAVVAVALALTVIAVLRIELYHRRAIGISHRGESEEEWQTEEPEEKRAPRER